MNAKDQSNNDDAIQKIKIKPAPMNSNVIWENISWQKFYKLRKYGIRLLTAGIIFVYFYYAFYVKRNL